MAAAVPTFESLDSALSVVDQLQSGIVVAVSHTPSHNVPVRRGNQIIRYQNVPEVRSAGSHMRLLIDSVTPEPKEVAEKLKLNIKARNSSGATALIVAVQKNLIDTVRFSTATGEEPAMAKTELMRLGQPPEAFTHVTDMKDFNKPSLFVIDQLLKAGIEINAEDNAGNTALDYARELGIAPVIQFLTDRGAKTSETPQFSAGITALESTIEELLLYIAMAQVPDTATGKKIEKLQRALAPFYEPPATPRPLKSDSATLQKVRAELLRTRDKLQEQLDSTLLTPELRLLKLRAMAAAFLPETKFIAIMEEEAPLSAPSSIATTSSQPATAAPEVVTTLLTVASSDAQRLKALLAQNTQ